MGAVYVMHVKRAVRYGTSYGWCLKSETFRQKMEAATALGYVPTTEFSLDT